MPCSYGCSFSAAARPCTGRDQKVYEFASSFKKVKALSDSDLKKVLRVRDLEDGSMYVLKMVAKNKLDKAGKTGRFEQDCCTFIGNCPILVRYKGEDYYSVKFASADDLLVTTIRAGEKGGHFLSNHQQCKIAMQLLAALENLSSPHPHLQVHHLLYSGSLGFGSLKLTGLVSTTCPDSRDGVDVAEKHRSLCREIYTVLFELFFSKHHHRRVPMPGEDITINGVKVVFINDVFKQHQCLTTSFEDYKKNDCQICSASCEEWDLWPCCKSLICRECSTKILQEMNATCPFCRASSSTVLRGYVIESNSVHDFLSDLVKPEPPSFSEMRAKLSWLNPYE